MDHNLTPQEEKELVEMFFFESQERHQRLNELLTSLESDLENHSYIDEILRITHTMKGNAMGMSQVGIADLSHVLEEVFETVNKGEVNLSKELFALLYKLTDKIGQLINNLKDGKRISHKGIKTKIQVFLKDANKNSQHSVSKNETPETNQQPASEAPNAIVNQDVQNDVPNKAVVEETTESVEEVSVEENIEEEATLETTRFSFSFSRIKQGFSDLLSRKFSRNEKATAVAESEVALDDVVQNEVIIEEESAQSVERNENPMDDSSIENSSTTTMEDRPNMTVDDEASVMEMLGEVLSSEQESESESNLHRELQNKVSMADMVQVPVRKLDILMNQVGQLIIERDRLLANEELSRSKKAELASLQRVTSDLQYSVMDVRLVQVGSLFSKFHRVARDVANIENKNINLVVKGSDVEIDRNILQIISDSMVHLVRNAVGHGIESEANRLAAGKPKVGTITLSARNEKDNVIIDVSDDGKGIDANQIRRKILEKKMLSADLLDQLSDDEVLMHIFDTGFSNAEKINEVSGRGVGMDVVKKSTESIGGQVTVTTEVGKGTTISLRLPASMVVKGVLLFMMGDQEFAVALPYTEAVISLKKSQIRKAGMGLISTYLNRTISILFLRDLLDINDLSQVYEQEVFHSSYDEAGDEDQFDVIVITYGGRYYGMVVDKLLQQKDIIEKPLPRPLDDNRLLSGTTIMGNGNVCLIIDAVAVTDLLFTSKLKIQEHLKAS